MQSSTSLSSFWPVKYNPSSPGVRREAIHTIVSARIVIAVAAMVFAIFGLPGCGAESEETWNDNSEQHGHNSNNNDEPDHECQEDTDCPFNDQICTWEGGRNICTPEQCNDNSDCTDSFRSICEHVDAFGRRACVSETARMDGLSCASFYDNGELECGEYDLQILECRNGQWEQVGECYDFDDCHAGNWIYCENDNGSELTSEGVAYSYPGDSCQGSFSGEHVGNFSCAVDGSALLECEEDEVWRESRSCSSGEHCRLIYDDEPNRQCGRGAETCVGCAD